MNSPKFYSLIFSAQPKLLLHKNVSEDFWNFSRETDAVIQYKNEEVTQIVLVSEQYRPTRLVAKRKVGLVGRVRVESEWKQRGVRASTKRRARNENPIVQTQFQSSVCSSQEPWAHKEDFVPAAKAHGIGYGGRMLPGRKLSATATKGLFSPILDMHPTQIPSIYSDLSENLGAV